MIMENNTVPLVELQDVSARVKTRQWRMAYHCQLCFYVT